MSNPEQLQNNPEIYRPTFNILAMYVGSQAGGPMEPREEIIIGDDGPEGSRYPHNGFWSNKRIPNKDRGLTVFSNEGLEIANIYLAEAHLRQFTPDMTRREIYVDIPNDLLNSLKPSKQEPGRVVSMGNAVLVATDPCTPCTHLAELNGFPEEQWHLVVKAFLNSGGMRFKVLQGGIITLDSKLEILS